MRYRPEIIKEPKLTTDIFRGKGSKDFWWEKISKIWTDLYSEECIENTITNFVFLLW